MSDRSETVLVQWRRLAESGPIWQACWDRLTAEERQRADRYHQPKDRARCVLGRGMVREILRHFAGAEQAAAEFTVNDCGKPELPRETNGSDVRFNVSHSGEVVIAAICRGLVIGIDVELIRSEKQQHAIARRYFAPREAGRIEELPPELREGAFFRCWTRKEAYLKARGTGIAGRLHGFEVSLRPEEPPAVLVVQDEPGEAAKWQMRDLETLPGHAAALAVRCAGLQLSRREATVDGELLEFAASVRSEERSELRANRWNDADGVLRDAETFV